MRSNYHKNDFFNYFFSLFLFLCSFFYPRSFFRFSFFFVISLSLPFLYHWCLFIIFISTIIWLSFTSPYLSFPFIFLSFILSLSFSLYYFISRLFLFSSFSFISPAPPPNRSLSRRPPFNCAHLWSRRTGPSAGACRVWPRPGAAPETPPPILAFLHAHARVWEQQGTPFFIRRTRAWSGRLPSPPVLPGQVADGRAALATALDENIVLIHAAVVSLGMSL